jgi:hypothetical protein
MNNKSIQTALAQLQYDWQDFSTEGYIQHLVVARQRPLHLIPVPVDDTSGVCVSTESDDYIFYDDRRHPVLQRHALFHESAHLVLKHITGAVHLSGISSVGDILIYINTRSLLVPRDPDEEREAEYFAFLAQRAVADGLHRKTANVTDRDADAHIPPFNDPESDNP